MKPAFTDLNPDVAVIFPGIAIRITASVFHAAPHTVKRLFVASFISVTSTAMNCFCFGRPLLLPAAARLGVTTPKAGTRSDCRTPAITDAKPSSHGAMTNRLLMEQLIQRDNREPVKLFSDEVLAPEQNPINQYFSHVTTRIRYLVSVGILGDNRGPTRSILAVG